jgi:Fe-S cluster biosynthesis and repair protein YggX
MENLVFCKKYQEELPAMDFPPLPGPAGKESMNVEWIYLILNLGLS